MNMKNILVLIVAAIGIGVIGTQVSFAGETEISPGIVLSNDQVIVVVSIGATVAIIRGLQGYDKSKDNWDGVVFLIGIKDAMLITVPFALGAAVFNHNPMVYDYVMLFFAVWGATAAYAKSKDPSIPANATDEQVNRLLDEKKYKR